MGRVLAIDYGKKRVGLAVTDPLKIVASGLDTVETREIFPFLKNYMEKEPVERFVVGEPTNLDGTDTHATPLVKEFVKGLMKRFPNTPIDLVDESFTSRMAVQTMVESGIGKMKRRNKGLIDKISATLILQSWMEQNK